MLGVSNASAATELKRLTSGATAVLSYNCCAEVAALERVGGFRQTADPVTGAVQSLAIALTPWSDIAHGKRLTEQASTLFGRNSSEDMLYALFFVIHAFVLELDLVRYTVNPTWEKGPQRNVEEFAEMCRCCGSEIATAINDPETK